MPSCCPLRGAAIDWGARIHFPEREPQQQLDKRTRSGDQLAATAKKSRGGQRGEKRKGHRRTRSGGLAGSRGQASQKKDKKRTTGGRRTDTAFTGVQDVSKKRAKLHALGTMKRRTLDLTRCFLPKNCNTAKIAQVRVRSSVRLFMVPGVIFSKFHIIPYTQRLDVLASLHDESRRVCIRGTG